MSDKNFDNIKVSINIDKAIEIGARRALKEQKVKSKNKYKKIPKIVAASLAGVITLGVLSPSLASQLPIIGNVFEAIEKNIHFPGNYSQYATSINETAYSNGIGITLSEVMCDGQSLYVTYIVENEEPFKHTSWQNGKELDMNQLVTGESYNKVDFTNEELDNSGLAGLEGKFIDEYTFVGVQKYDMSNMKDEIPNEFNFKTKIKLIENYSTKGGEKDYIKWGTWAFSVPVKVNKDLQKVINVENIESDDIKINTIFLTPFEMLIEHTYKKGDWSGYAIRVYDENGKKLSSTQTSIDDAGKVGKIYLQSPGNSKSIRILVEKPIFKDANTGKITPHAEFKPNTVYDEIGRNTLIDEVISLEK